MTSTEYPVRMAYVAEGLADSRLVDGFVRGAKTDYLLAEHHGVRRVMDGNIPVITNGVVSCTDRRSEPADEYSVTAYVVGPTGSATWSLPESDLAGS